MTVEEIQEQRAARKAELEKAKAEQFAIDLVALNDLEIEHGDDSVASLETERYVKGLPTMVVLRAPTAAEYKRFVDTIARSKDNMEARLKSQDLLARSVWVYPAKEQQDEMFSKFPGLLLSIVVRAQQMVEAKAKEEGKG